MVSAYEKSNIVHDPDRRRLWLAGQSRCACCWAVPGARGHAGMHLEAHHLIKAGVGGAGRSDEECCFLALCAGFAEDGRPRCHDLAELMRIRRPDGKLWPRLTLPICLGLKLDSDPENWNPERLIAIRHRGLPDIEPLPMEFVEERRRNDRLAR